MAAPKKSLYQILGLAPDANEIDIGLAYEKRKNELQRASPQDPSALAIAHQAHEILSNKKRRAAYDASLVTQAEKAAAAEQAQSPDLVLEGGEEEEKPRNKLVLAAIAGVIVLAVILFFVLRPGGDTRKAEAPPPAPAPKPEPPPPPPKPMGAHQILPAALLSVGQVNSYDMSGRAVPIGLALAVESGAVVTTCHAIPAGSKLVVRIGAETNSADLSTVDEVLDLCRLQVPGLNAKAFTVAPDDARPNEKIFMLGANAKGEFALTEGTVKSVRTVDGTRMLEVSMPIAANGSGGAVLNPFGQLVGIANAQQTAIAASAIAQMRSRNKKQPP